MKAALLSTGPTLGLLACLGLGPMALAASGPAPDRGPLLVVALPWGGGASAAVRSAGGRLVGPGAAPWAVLAAGASPDALRAAGAWLILDPATPGVFCGGDAR